MKNTATIQTHDQKFDYKKNFENERYSDVHSYTILTLYVFQVSNIYPLNVSEQPVSGHSCVLCPVWEFIGVSPMTALLCHSFFSFLGFCQIALCISAPNSKYPLLIPPLLSIFKSSSTFKYYLWTFSFIPMTLITNMPLTPKS